MQLCVASVLGAMQILVGLVNLGLGPGHTHLRPRDLTSLWASYWLGATFVVAGLITIFSGLYRSRWLALSTLVLNILGSLCAISGIVLFALDLSQVSVSWMCESRADGAPCRKVAAVAQRALCWMDITVLVLLVLQLCVNISSAVLSFRLKVHRGQSDLQKDSA